VTASLNQTEIEISVVIPTYQRSRILSQSLKTLLTQDFPHRRYEIIIVSDGPDDGILNDVREMKTRCSLLVLNQAHGGQAAARNTGWQKAMGRVVLFLDDDLLCEPDLLTQHMEAHGGEPCLAFGPILTFAADAKNLASEVISIHLNRYYDNLCPSRPLAWPEDACVRPNSSVARNILVRLGGFDERFYRGREDTDLGLRLWKAGIKFRFLPAAGVRQIHAKTAEELVRDAEDFGRNDILLSRKHRDYHPARFGSLHKRASLRTAIRQVLVRMPVSPDPVLRWAYYLFQRYNRPAIMRKVALRLLSLRQTITWYRAARREAGSWNGVLRILKTRNVGPK